MTMHTTRRCRHCQVRYSYQVSGWSPNPDNRDDYCTGCSRVIREALAHVPLRVEKVWVEAAPSTYPTAPVLHDEETRRIEELRAAGVLVGRRVGIPLYDLDDLSNTNIVGFARINAVWVSYSFWANDPEGTSVVKVPMERDLETGEETPWIEIQGGT